MYRLVVNEIANFFVERLQSSRAAGALCVVGPINPSATKRRESGKRKSSAEQGLVASSTTYLVLSAGRGDIDAGKDVVEPRSHKSGE